MSRMNSHVFWYYLELCHTARLLGVDQEEIEVLLVHLAREYSDMCIEGDQECEFSLAS